MVRTASPVSCGASVSVSTAGVPVPFKVFPLRILSVRTAPGALLPLYEYPFVELPTAFQPAAGRGNVSLWGPSPLVSVIESEAPTAVGAALGSGRPAGSLDWSLKLVLPPFFTTS